jgi:hypothetical protein
MSHITIRQGVGKSGITSVTNGDTASYIQEVTNTKTLSPSEWAEVLELDTPPAPVEDDAAIRQAVNKDLSSKGITPPATMARKRTSRGGSTGATPPKKTSTDS